MPMFIAFCKSVTPQRGSDAELTLGLIPLTVARHQRYFVNRLNIRNGVPQGQRYSWNYNDDVPVPYTEDTSHGNLDMSCLNVLRHGFAALLANKRFSMDKQPL